MSNQLEMIITVVIIAMMAFAVWRSGQANPVGTGRIARDVAEIRSSLTEIGNDARAGREAKHKTANLEMSVKGLEGMIKNAPTIERLDEFEREVEGRLSKVEVALANCATKADVARIEGGQARIDAKIEGVCDKLGGVDAAVIRIEQHLLGRGK